MREDVGNLWTYPADVVVITTNGFVKNNGEAVMGKGCALEAKQRYPWLPKELGEAIRYEGLQGFFIKTGEIPLWSFPVKYNWWEEADLNLIKKGAKELFNFSTAQHKYKTFVLPRPGCGNGKRDWKTEVKPILEPILDDGFTVITYE